MSLWLRKSFSRLLVLIMLLSLVSNHQNVVFANEIYDFGGGVTGTLENGTFRVSKTGEGTGDMNSFENAKNSFTPIYNLKGIVNVEIGEGVRLIGKGAFYKSEDSKITGKVTIEDSVKWIAKEAFYKNEITELIIGNDVRFIADNAFGDNLLTALIIPDSVTGVSLGAFSKNSLTELTIGNNVITIGINAFVDNKLQSIIIPDGVKKIDDRAFYDNPLTKIRIPSKVILGKSAFGEVRFELDYEKNENQEGIYELNSTRDKWEIKAPKSGDTRLSSLTIDDIIVADFDEKTTEYALENTRSEKIKIDATTLDARASITGDIGENSLIEGLNTFQITVTAEDETVEIYTINITREKLVIPDIPPQIEKPEVDKPEVDKPEVDKPEVDKPEVDKPGEDSYDSSKSESKDREIKLEAKDEKQSKLKLNIKKVEEQINKLLKKISKYFTKLNSIIVPSAENHWSKESVNNNTNTEFTSRIKSN